MIISENAINVLVVKSYKGIGKAWIIKNSIGGDNITSIITKLNVKLNHIVTLSEFEERKSLLKSKLLSKLSDFTDGVIAIGDKDFPVHRGLVKDSEKPVFIYFKGDITLLNSQKKIVTVIGLLNPEKEIEEHERLIVSELVKNDILILSGLALGCDSIAHEETLLMSGKTIAILPSNLINILPKKNKDLANRIVNSGGLLITEYGNDFKNLMELNSRYKERDRLQALYCDYMILAASYSNDSSKRWNIFDKKLDSGARLAMGFAKQYNIPRAVIYEKTLHVNNPMYDLNREIIKESKDILIISPINYRQDVEQVLKHLSNITQLNNQQPDLFF